MELMIGHPTRGWYPTRRTGWCICRPIGRYARTGGGDGTLQSCFTPLLTRRLLPPEARRAPEPDATRLPVRSVLLWRLVLAEARLLLGQLLAPLLGCTLPCCVLVRLLLLSLPEDFLSLPEDLLLLPEVFLLEEPELTFVPEARSWLLVDVDVDVAV